MRDFPERRRLVDVDDDDQPTLPSTLPHRGDHPPCTVVFEDDEDMAVKLALELFPSHLTLFTPHRRRHWLQLITGNRVERLAGMWGFVDGVEVIQL